jgi:exosome complex component RRP45
MPREAEPSLNEKQFVLKALEENLRLDGRESDQYRPLDATFGDQYGVVDVKLGKTRYTRFDSLPLSRLDVSLTHI